MYTKKSILQNLIQNYVYLLICKNEIQIYQNSICLLDEQIEVSKQLKANGTASQTQITELKSSQWSYQQDLMSVQVNYETYLQNLKSICGVDFEDEIQFALPKNIIATILTSTGNISDPLEKSYQLKIEILKTNHILEKQNSAPIVSLSVQPTWTFEHKKQDEWKDAWKDLDSPSNWSATVSLNLSPLLTAMVKQNKKQYQLDYQAIENIYNAYVTQRNFVLQQYQTILDHYKEQLKQVTNLYNEGITEVTDLETQYNAGVISKLDYDSAKIQVDNCKLSKGIVEMYVWLYEILITLIS